MMSLTFWQAQKEVQVTSINKKVEQNIDKSGIVVGIDRFLLFDQWPTMSWLSLHEPSPSLLRRTIILMKTSRVAIAFPGRI